MQFFLKLTACSIKVGQCACFYLINLNKFPSFFPPPRLRITFYDPSDGLAANIIAGKLLSIEFVIFGSDLNESVLFRPHQPPFKTIRHCFARSFYMNKINYDNLIICSKYLMCRIYGEWSFIGFKKNSVLGRVVFVHLPTYLHNLIDFILCSLTIIFHLFSGNPLKSHELCFIEYNSHQVSDKKVIVWWF